MSHPDMHPRFGLCFAAALVTGLAASLVVGSAQAQTMVAQPPVPPPPGTQWVWVTLPSLDRNAAIEAFEGIKSHDADDDDAWRKLCTEPCGMWIPSGTRLRVNGDFRVSAPFALPARQGGAHLTVDPVRSGLRVTGIVFMPIGGFFTFIGGLVFLATDSRNGTTREERELRAIGGGFALFGLATLGTGLALFLTNQKTTVDIRDPNGAGRVAFPTALPRVAVGKGLWLSPEGMHF